MRIAKLAAGTLLAMGLAGCQNLIPQEMSVADYCANPDKAQENVCRLKVEIDGQSTALSDTDMRLSDARGVADSAASAAAQAQATADAAMQRAEEAMSRTDEMVCETRTVQKTDTGTCRPGYTLTSCTQTRYTTRAGGLSFLREINDEKCRFNDRVLEMQVRCCNTASAAPAPQDETVDENMPEPEATPEAPEESPLSF
ncbi:alanine-zipper protein [Hyphomonas sp.]|uniref:alanine-zipper protein n=1 Tax=Hyphomonas sp. TaxID=87 RepID=UPI0032EDC0ED|tara:strand:+ start:23795 stop:24391 length:597 start_codon:yes stop_codon:yes gene_type:complete